VVAGEKPEVDSRDEEGSTPEGRICYTYRLAENI